jgi:hypothetical protein
MKIEDILGLTIDRREFDYFHDPAVNGTKKNNNIQTTNL